MLPTLSLTLLTLLPLLPTALAADLATTSRYTDTGMGSCGCGNKSTGQGFPWQQKIASGVYTAAGSPALFDTGSKSWCGSGCGTCYTLTNTGSSPEGTGVGGGTSIIVMLTNLCPNAGNEKWCPPVGGKNQFGYGAHFDILFGDGGIGWDNPVVEYEKVACPAVAGDSFKQCYCATHTS